MFGGREDAAGAADQFSPLRDPSDEGELPGRAKLSLERGGCIRPAGEKLLTCVQARKHDRIEEKKAPSRSGEGAGGFRDSLDLRQASVLRNIAYVGCPFSERLSARHISLGHVECEPMLQDAWLTAGLTNPVKSKRPSRDRAFHIEIVSLQIASTR